LDSHRAEGKSQIKGASGSAVSAMLGKFGETRPFLKEGGRTNRGGPGDIGMMLSTLRKTGLEKLEQYEREEILDNLQGYLVDRVKEYHNRERLKVFYNPFKSAYQSIQDLLSLARETGKEGPVAQYLVGAKLQLRFSSIQVRNDSYSAADDQIDSPGDFYLGDTAFHVTVAPMQGVYEKCRKNIEERLRVFILVPDRLVIGSKQNVENIHGPITVQAIESFVGQNLEELAEFSTDRLTDGFVCLIKKYNERVDAVETDKSMLIEMPRNLSKIKPR